MQIPIQIRVRDAGRSPPDVTVEPTCVRASTRDTLEWVLQGAGQFTIEFAEGATPFGSDFGLVSDRFGCCSAHVAGQAEPGIYHYKVHCDATACGIPMHFLIDGPEIVLQ
jgi:hypothetical protein